MVCTLDSLKWVFWIGLPACGKLRGMITGDTLRTVALRVIFMGSLLGKYYFLFLST